MQRMVSRLSLIMLASACGNVHTPFSEKHAELAVPDAATPDASRALPASNMITVRFPDIPDDLPREHLRAALVWTEGNGAHPEDRPRDEPAWKALVKSDVEVTYASPLEIHIKVDAPEPRAHLDYADSGPEYEQLHDTKFYSLPTAEVVLYHDGNHNGSLDLLLAGESGPGPDKMLALSSGRDQQGNAKRSLIVNKRNPLSQSYLSAVPGVYPFWLPQPEDPKHKSLGNGPFPEEGLYNITLSIHSNDSLAQLALLNGYTDMPTFNFTRRDDQYRASALAEIARVHEISVTLYKVDPDRIAWLPRGCMPWLTEGLDETPLPPPGAAIQCGVAKLIYATSPDNYCGQAVELDQFEWEKQTAEPWPCAERGLIEGTPYVASSQRLDGDPLLFSSVRPLVGTRLLSPKPDFRCDKHLIYDFDEEPAWHLPSIAPEPGSQIKCYDHESFSYIPPRKDGCNFKFSYELSSQYYEAAKGVGIHWNLRSDPPAWWPCDDEGKLRSDLGYEPPRELPGYNCEYAGLPQIDPENPPPPNSQIRCLSDITYRLRPLWFDPCDGSATIASAGGVLVNGQYTTWTGVPDQGWPCDKEGKLKIRRGLSAW